MVLLCVIGVTVYFVTSGANDYGKVSGAPSDVHATEASFIAANVLIENLGSPTPAGLTASSWMLKSHAVSLARNGVVAPSYPWISAAGRLIPLSARSAQNLSIAELSVISQFFTGQAKSDTTSELHQIIAGEVGGHPSISAPGGAKIVKWLRVNVAGNVAHLEADVNVWESTPNLQQIGSRFTLVPSLNSNQVDALATLDRVGSRWLITSFNQAPWQQAT